MRPIFGHLREEIVRYTNTKTETFFHTQIHRCSIFNVTESLPFTADTRTLFPKMKNASAFSSLLVLALLVFTSFTVAAQTPADADAYRADADIVASGTGPNGDLWFKVRVKIFEKESGAFKGEYVSFVGDVKAAHKAKIAQADEGAEIRLWPNPAKDEINLEWRRVGAKVDVKVLDMKGRTVIDRQIDTAQGGALDISELEMGIYFLCADDGEKVVTLKFVKE